MLDKRAVRDLMLIARANPSVRSSIVRVLRRHVPRTAKVKTEHQCMIKYQTEAGDFKGGKGEAFDNCVKAFNECATGVKDAEALCASIGRSTGKIAASSYLSSKGRARVWEDAFSVATRKGERPRVAALFADVVLARAAPKASAMLSIDEVRSLCPPCARKMASRGLKKIAFGVLVSSPDFLGSRSAR